MKSLVTPYHKQRKTPAVEIKSDFILVMFLSHDGKHSTEILCPKFKGVRGSFAISFWLPCATWHRVMTHTHHTHFDRRTLFFATRRKGRSEGFLLHPNGLSFGFQARCTASSCDRHVTRTNSKDIERRIRWRRQSIIEQVSGCMVDLSNLSWAVLCGSQRGLCFFFFALADLGNE